MLLRAYVYVLVGAFVLWAGAVVWFAGRSLQRALRHRSNRVGA